jgi:uncharacterized Zn finger protein
MGMGIANILHRETIAVIVGTKTFERGESCFTAGRVVQVESIRGELRGAVRPTARARPDYTIRIWVREEGVAYECTCPVGVKLQFCKHAVALALAHLAKERATAEQSHQLLRDALATCPPAGLVDGLVGLARRDPELATSLKRMCLEILATR